MPQATQSTVGSNVEQSLLPIGEAFKQLIVFKSPSTLIAKGHFLQRDRMGVQSPSLDLSSSFENIVKNNFMAKTNIWTTNPMQCYKTQFTWKRIKLVKKDDSILKLLNKACMIIPIYPGRGHLIFPNDEFGKGQYAFYPIKLYRFAKKRIKFIKNTKIS